MAAVLYVGEDLCRRIPFMEQEGFTVVRSERSAIEVEAAVRRNPRFDAIALEHDTSPIPASIIPAVRQRTDSPLVLFHNPNLAKFYGIDHDDDAFDLIIPPLTAPAVWLKTLQALIAEGQELRAASRDLVRMSALECSKTETLVHSSEDLRRSFRSIDFDAIWRGDSEQGQKSLSTESPQ